MFPMSPLNWSTISTTASSLPTGNNLVEQLRNTMDLFRNMPRPIKAVVMSAKCVARFPKGDPKDPLDPFYPSLYAVRVLVWHNAKELRKIMDRPDGKELDYVHCDEGERFLIEAEGFASRQAEFTHASPPASPPPESADPGT